tara:strand:+ start:98 stop:2347 length:2250 start_codon:yes stop_codon:yes gene_type:complete
MIRFFIIFFLLFDFCTKAFSEEEETIILPDIEIQSSIGDRTRLTPGATNYVDRESMNRSRGLTVGETIEEIPGVISEMDDGDTRKGNFGIRGAHSRRSRKISVYEDYNPLNFAPYTDPTTHYIPPDERIGGIEVIKGSGQLTHGPQTMHGIINFLNHRPPKEGAGKIITSFGESNIGPRQQYHIRYGKDFGRIGNWQAMFTRHDNRGPVKGDIVDYNDYFLNGDIELTSNQKLAVTLNYNHEDSEYHEGGYGLAQYVADPEMGNNRLFDDTFEMDIVRTSLAHSYFASDTLKIDTNFYYNFVTRERWSQTDNESAGLVIREDIDCDDEGARVDRVAAVSNSGCGYKNTPRRYHTAGIETRFYKDLNLFGKSNNLKYGAKFEFEKVERKARITGSDKKQTGTQFTEDEYAKSSEDAEVYALALYLEDDIQYSDKLILTPGLRYESYYLIHNDRDKNDGAGENGKNANNYTSYEKDEYILLPGLGFTYEANNANQIYGGAHMGMAPPSVGDAGYRQISNLKSQKSFNFELGLINSNFEDKYGLTFETAAFRTVERNRPVKSSLRTTGTGSTLKNIGTTFTDGVEFLVNWDQSKYSKTSRNWFATLTYSFMYPKLKTHQLGERSSDDAGAVTIVDDIYENDIPFVPRHKGLLTVGYGVQDKWDVSTTARYRGEYFTDIDNSKGIGQAGRFGQVDDHWVINARGNYTFSKFNNSTLYLSLTNMFDTTYIASISAEGLKVGNGRSIMTGLEYNF